MKGDILSDGSVEGQTFSGPNYKGDFPVPRYGQETYRQYYERVQAAAEEGFHKGDLSWHDWTIYLYGCPGGGGQHIQDYIIGEDPSTNDEDYY